MPITEISMDKRDAFVRANQGEGILENCIVHRTPACLERGAMYVRQPSNTITSGGVPSGTQGGAHICPDCGAWLRGDAS